MKCVRDRVKIAVAFHIGVSVLTATWSEIFYVHWQDSDLSARCTSLSAREEHGKQLRYRWHFQGADLLLDIFMSFAHIW